MSWCDKMRKGKLYPRGDRRNVGVEEEKISALSLGWARVGWGSGNEMTEYTENLKFFLVLADRNNLALVRC